MRTKGRLHRLVDELPDSEVAAAERFLSYLRDVAGDPFLRALTKAPEDDEPETPEEAAGVHQAYDDIAAGRVISHKGASRRLLRT